MIVAGHDTTASTITYTLYYLANHPQVLKKAQGIVDQVLKNRDPEYSDFDDLYYINWIIKEAMRLTPVVKGIPRTLEKTIEWGGYEIPKGTLVFTPFNTHKDPEFFPDPLAFKPERWDGLEFSNRYAYTPFGFGNRACIGKKFAMIEAVIALSMIIQRYNVSIDKDYGPLDITTVVTSKPAKDLYVTFTKR
jgi:cytochrome P450